MHPSVQDLFQSFRAHSNKAEAVIMSDYLKGHFPFFGIKAMQRRELMWVQLRVYGKLDLPTIEVIVKELYAFPVRELHQAAVDLLMKYARELGPQHLPLLEDLITTHSWWDTVDALAVNVVGVILKKHPKAIAKWNKRWIGSNDMWLIRTAILFQNHWKDDTDRELLFANIDRHAGHPDFFIRKAIGWALRSLGDTDAKAVLSFVASRDLSPLSRREATRKLN